MMSDRTQRTETALDEKALGEMEARAVELARGAGALLRRYFGGPMTVEYKDKRKNDPVTEADRLCQQYLKDELSRGYPDHGVVAEEDPAEDNQPARDLTWVLDPLDGTKNYLAGLPIFACSIGLLHRGVPVVAAVYLPWPHLEGGAVLHGHRGGGAYVDGRPVHVMKVDQPQGNNLIALPASMSRGFRLRSPLRARAGEVRVTGSIAYEFALTAMGALQYTVVTRPRLWDVAAGTLLIREAGGLVAAVQRRRALTVFRRLRWAPLESFFPSWESGRTTTAELRGWSESMVLGSPGVVEYVTANLVPRRRWRLSVARQTREGTLSHP